MMPAGSPGGSGTSADPEGREPRGRRWRLAVQAGALVVLAGTIVWANLHAADHDLLREAVRRFGYMGLFAAAAISGFNLLVPVPVIAFFPVLVQSGLEPVLTVVVIAAGMTTGDLIGYLVGHTARQVMGERDHRILRRLGSLRERHRVLPFVVMFLYAAFAPVPNEVLVIPLAFLRYPVAGIFTAVLLGNLIFNSLVAVGVMRVFG